MLYKPPGHKNSTSVELGIPYCEFSVPALFALILKKKKLWFVLCFVCRYDPNKFEPEDDDSDMETDFAGIEKEERRR